MGVADVNSFVQSACVCFRRDELFDDPHGGASGTVIKQVFIDWITLNMSERAACPRLLASDIVASSKSFSSPLIFHILEYKFIFRDE
jgi:hypothetical protein